MPMLEYDVRRIEVQDVYLSKSISNPFDPLLIVRDPYTQERIEKEPKFFVLSWISAL